MKNLDSILPISDEGLYPIRTVSEVTGVNSITLRAWERRYNLFKPKRTLKGHRLYSDKDIQRINQVLALLDKGVSIGRVASAIKKTQIESNVPSLLSVKTTGFDSKKLTKKQWIKHQYDLLNKINSFDILELERFHHNLLSQYPVESVIQNLITPSLDSLKKRIKKIPSLSGEYSFYKMFILHRLGGLSIKSSVQNTGEKILLMGLKSQHCDAELLLFAMPLIKLGYQIVILGYEVSLEAIPVILPASNAKGLIFYSDAESTNDLSIKALHNIVNCTNRPTFITGEYSKDQEKRLNQSGLNTLPTSSKKQFVTINKILNKNIKLH